MSMEESISLEETNKIRISLGLKPLSDGPTPADNAEKQAEDNYANQREKAQKERESKKIADRIAKVRNRRELNSSLKGSTLGDADAEGDDALNWVKKSKKREKALAKKRLEELESRDNMYQDEYTERDLEGLKVSHDLDALDEGEARILTLKDSRILDNEEDELQNVEMAEEERHKQRKENTIKKRDYTGYDDDEFAEGKAGMKRSVLSKYDEDIDGVAETGFRLGSNTVSKRVEKEEITTTAGGTTVNRSLLSIDYAKNLETNDYLKEGDIGFKKPKTKKKKSSRRAPAAAELADPEDMAVDSAPFVPRVRDLDANFVDDDELQAALARSRKAKLRKPKKISPEELARKIAEDRQQEDETMDIIKVEDGEPEGEDEDNGGLILDDTSEFVRAIGHNPVQVKQDPESAPEVASAVVAAAASSTTDVAMEPVTELIVNELDTHVKDEPDEEDEMAMLNDIEAAIKATEAEQVDPDAVGTAGEQSHSSGMAATLNILRQQGILATPSADNVDRERTQLQRDLWLADQRKRVAERELEKAQGRGTNKDQATREYENRMREQQEARENLEAFKNYKPDVNIVYYDDFGRALTSKEAWKALSHKFHGKGSGKMKTEKHLKKIAEEKKREAMASGDTPMSMSAAFQQRQEKAGQAHFVLSVGNRGAVPQAAEFLDAQPLAKGKTEKKKKKAAANGKGNGFMTVPAPNASLSASPAPGSTTGSPAPRAGFSRISSVVESVDGASGSGERSKVTFGFGAKRKAEGEAPGSPASKASRR